MFLAPFMLGLSPTGMRRLPSGHGGHGHDDDHDHDHGDDLRLQLTGDGFRQNS